jgi:hypothetical protein
MNSSAMFSCTRRREPAQQVWPWLKKMACTMPSTAASWSAESNTTTGDLPPSSSVIFLPVPAVSLRRKRPTLVEPVKATLATSGWLARCVPTSLPPATMLTTPAGRPASAMMSQKRKAERLVEGAGLSTTVLPMARAGAIFHASISMGKFHGMIWPMTPSGFQPGTADFMICAQPAWW